MKKINDPGPGAPTLSFYAALQRAYEHFNAQLFDHALPHCLITVQRERGTWGFFSAERWAHNPSGKTLHEIALNPAYFARHSVLEVFQTLVHEMVHLWQHEHGKPSRARYHNSEWAEKMERLGLMPSDTGQPGGRRTGQCMNDYPIRGGRFEVAARALIEADFLLPWLDRFPVAGSTKPMTQGTASAAASNAIRPMDALGEERVVTTDTESTTEREDAVWKCLSTPLVNIVPSLAETTQTVRLAAVKKLKTTYMCACGHKVWGKPGLQLYCGTCNGPFATVS